MSKVKKRKIKIKKKNFTIFVFLIFLILFIIIKGTNKIIELIESPKKENKQIETKTEYEKKLETLNNVNKKINYFNKRYIDRYIKYKKEHSNLSDKQIIKNVNMNLDLIQYKDIKKAKNLNTEKILVNKYYYLEENYIPKNLEKISTNYALSNMQLVDIAKDAFESLAKDAKKEDLNIVAMSTYRSYDYQVELYNNYVRADGKEAADTYSGRPGHSEHQTGLAVDVYNKEENYTNFEKTDEYKWMQEHAHEYGFILRFPKDKEKETGYQFESWHYRYVGKEAAQYIKENNISFEEYYATIIKDW